MLFNTRKCSTPNINRLNAKSTISEAKLRRTNMIELENEVNKSRNAIENMSHAKAIDSNLYKKIQQLHNHLHTCMLALNHEISKQKILNNLIQLLKKQMSDVESIQRNEEEYTMNAYQKKIKKVQYDIKQILQKYNEQIAKINLLKEQANAARDQRVVYSNLFNKIEKQIKKYDERYIQTLLKNQISLDKKRLTSTNTQYSQNFHQISSEKQFQIYNQFTQINLNNDSRSIQQQNKISQEDFFHNKKVKNIKNNTHQAFLTGINHQNMSRVLVRRSSRMAVPKQNPISIQISQTQALINAIVIKSQCKTSQQVFHHYSIVQKQNQALTNYIESMQNNIIQLQKQINKLQKNKNSLQIQNKQQILMNQKEQKVEKNEQTQCFTIFRQIIKLFNLQYTSINSQIFSQIDSCCQQLGINYFQNRHYKQTKMITHTDQKSLDQLLEKIDKFTQSQRIFDRKALAGQYQKQILKVKKKGKKYI